MDLTIAIIAAAAAVAAAIAALGSWKAARKSNDTAAVMAGIERSRRHQELTPDFDITLTSRDPDAVILCLALKPGTLQRLDEVTVTIVDEAGREHWTQGLPGGVSQEEAEMFVWGPWEFNTGASEQVASNRTSKPRAYSLTTGKNWGVLPLTPTRPGRWMSTTPADWRRQHADQPVRLRITCRRDGHEHEWTVLREVKAEPGGPFVA